MIIFTVRRKTNSFINIKSFTNIDKTIESINIDINTQMDDFKHKNRYVDESKAFTE